jgi:hypothetical protein
MSEIRSWGGALTKEVTLKLTDLPERDPYLVLSDLDGQHYLFHSKKTVFLTLNDTAYEILKLCNGNNSIMDILRAVASKYGVPAQEILQDVVEYLALLSETAVIEIRGNFVSKGGDENGNL